MTEDARVEWLAVAWATLSHLPADLLRYGAQKAREQADHPSKIVPVIVAETKHWLAQRRDIHRPTAEPAPQIEKRVCTPAEAASILRELGLRSINDGVPA